MGEIGTRLKSAREARHISIRTAAKRLKIREQYLVAMEEEAFDQLPQGAYLLGFLRNYAVFLGLNYREIRDHYFTHYGKPKTYEDLKPGRKTTTRASFVLTPGKMIAFFVALASGLLLFYLFNQYQVLTSPPELSVFLPRDGEVYNVKQIEILGRTDPDAIVTINGEETALSADGEFERQFVAIKNGPAKLEIVARNRISDKETRVTRTFTVDLPTSEVITVNEQGQLNQTPEDGDESAEQTEGNGTSTADDGELELVVRAVDRVWFSTQLDDGPVEEFILEKGQTKVLSAAESIFVHSGKAYAAYGSLNGGEEEQLGETSVVKRTFTADDLPEGSN